MSNQGMENTVCSLLRILHHSWWFIFVFLLSVNVKIWNIIESRIHEEIYLTCTLLSVISRENCLIILVGWVSLRLPLLYSSCIHESLHYCLDLSDCDNGLSSTSDLAAVFDLFFSSSMYFFMWQNYNHKTVYVYYI